MHIAPVPALGRGVFTLARPLLACDDWNCMLDLAFFAENHWQVVDVLHTPERTAVLESTDDIPVEPRVQAFLQRAYPKGIYRHQKTASLQPRG